MPFTDIYRKQVQLILQTLNRPGFPGDSLV